MKRFNPSLPRMTFSNLLWRSSTPLTSVALLFISGLRGARWLCESVRAPNKSVSNHLSLRSSDTSGVIAGSEGLGYPSISRSATKDSEMDAICNGEGCDEVPPLGGGEDGGVDVDNTRCRCTSPRKTLPICDIVRQRKV